MKKPRPLYRTPAPVALALPGGAADPNVVDDSTRWIQVSAEGDYHGHPSGAFKLDAQVFAQIVANFRAHPSYVAGGGADVIPYDISHASEQDPTSGMVAVTGTPAQAWARELEIRQGAKGLELWALTRLLEPMRTYVAEGKYKWTSITLWEHYPEPKSGKDMGWYVSSIAFTNDPFVQGMHPIAASRMSFDPYCPPTTPEEVMQCLRELFELDAMAPSDEVLASLAKLRSYTESPAAAPVGVDVFEMVGELRRIFNLPTLTPVEDVFAETESLMAALVAEQNRTTIAATRKDAHMDRFEKACYALAGQLRVKLSGASDEDVTAILCQAAAASVDSADAAMAKLTAFCQAVGAPDPEAAAQKIVEDYKRMADLEAVMPELMALREAKAKDDANQEEADVDTAMQAHRLPPNARPALLLVRKQGRDKFTALYPLPTATQLALSTPRATVAGAQVQLGGPAPRQAPVSIDPTLIDANGHPITLETIRKFQGPNDGIRAQRYLESLPGNSTLPREVIWERATMLTRALARQAQGTPSLGAPSSI